MITTAGATPARLSGSAVAKVAVNSGAAVVVTGALYVLLDQKVLGAGPVTAYQWATDLIRASGLTAMIWCYVGLFVGLSLGTKSFGQLIRGRRAQWEGLHRHLNLVVLALMFLHALTFALGTPGGSLLVAFVPQTAQVGAIGYSLGVLAIYLVLILGPTYYLRASIGRRTWLVVHQFAALSYAAALWHTLLLGSSFRMDGTVRDLLWVLQVPLIWMLLLRLARPRRPADALDAGRHDPRFNSRRHAIRRIAVHTGILTTVSVILIVALAAAGEGQHGTRNPNAAVVLRG